MSTLCSYQQEPDLLGFPPFAEILTPIAFRRQETVAAHGEPEALTPSGKASIKVGMDRAANTEMIVAMTGSRRQGTAARIIQAPAGIPVPEICRTVAKEGAGGSWTHDARKLGPPNGQTWIDQSPRDVRAPDAGKYDSANAGNTPHAARALENEHAASENEHAASDGGGVPRTVNLWASPEPGDGLVTTPHS